MCVNEQSEELNSQMFHTSPHRHLREAFEEKFYAQLLWFSSYLLIESVISPAHGPCSFGKCIPFSV